MNATFFSEGQEWGVDVRRQQKSAGLNPVSNKLDTGALELLVLRFPELGRTSFCLNTVVGLESVNPVDLALVLLLPLLVLLLAS